MTDPAWLTRLEKATDAEGHHMSGFAANEIAKEFREQQAEIEKLKHEEVMLRFETRHLTVQRDEAREAAREMYSHFFLSDRSDGPNLAFWKQKHPWLEEK